MGDMAPVLPLSKETATNSVAAVACNNCARGEDEEVAEVGEDVEEEVLEDRSTQKNRMEVPIVCWDSRK